MALEKIKSVVAKAVVIRGDDIDTDRIIPARFLKSVTFEGLGEFAFYDERKNPDGSDKPHPLNEPVAKGASILISGMNFGCGSSREHAPQALWRRGFRAIIAGSFGEIFFGNATKLGMVCVCAPREILEEISNWLEKNPTEEICVDLEKLRIDFGDKSFSVEMPDAIRRALLDGRWDPIADLLESSDKISALAKTLP